MKPTLTVCPYCGTGCMFHLLQDDSGRLTGVEPSGGHRISRGQLCVKGWNAHAFVQHPDRLTTPLIRRDGQLQPASWGEALDLVHSRLTQLADQHGSDSLMFLSSAKVSNEENYLLMKLARAGFGTNNIDHCARLCHSSTVTGLVETLGSGAMTNSIDCIDQTDLMLVIGGFNSANTSRLATLCREQQPDTYHIETSDQLEAEWFAGKERIGVTAGASTPRWIIEEVLESIQKISGLTE